MQQTLEGWEESKTEEILAARKKAIEEQEESLVQSAPGSICRAVDLPHAYYKSGVGQTTNSRLMIEVGVYFKLLNDVDGRHRFTSAHSSSVLGSSFCPWPILASVLDPGTPRTRRSSRSAGLSPSSWSEGDLVQPIGQILVW